LTGTIIRIDGRRCLIHYNGKNYRAYIKTKIHGAMLDEARPVAVGDRVNFEQRPNGDVLITEVLPRKSWLNRRSVSNINKQQVIVSNVDQLMIVTSVQDPLFQPGIIDRFLVSATKGNLEAKIIINKMDLLAISEDKKRIESTLKVYKNLGYTVLYTSIFDDASIAELKSHLLNKSTVFAGHSGTGKSSLLMAIAPHLKLRVGEVSEKHGKGRHTTTSIRLMPLGENSFVVDTPGIREFSLWQLDIAEVSHYFPEMASILSACKYNDCTHTHEPFCAVKEAWEAGDIANFRYESYCNIIESIKNPQLDFMAKFD